MSVGMAPNSLGNLGIAPVGCQTTCVDEVETLYGLRHPTNG